MLIGKGVFKKTAIPICEIAVFSIRVRLASPWRPSQRTAFIKQLQIVSREQGIIQLGQFILRNVVYSVRVRLYVNGYALLLSESRTFHPLCHNVVHPLIEEFH